MKKFRRIAQNPFAISLVLFNFIFVSCNRDEIVENQAEQQLQQKGIITKNLVSKQSQKTGEEIIRGIFFFQNEISDDIPFLYKFKQDIQKRSNYFQTESSLKEISDVTIDYIKINNPEFLNDLQKAFYSNNLFEIDQKLDECVTILTKALESSDKYSEAIQFGYKIQNDEKLKKFIEGVDLSTTQGQTQLESFLNQNPEYKMMQEGSVNAAIPIFVGAAAVAYAVAAVVSIAAVLYSVYYKAAYWPKKGLSFEEVYQGDTLTREYVIAELANYFQASAE
ncbi:hypothetical protein [Chryseobacterium gleum]|uniref:hypothetical protein n=1 Tax=Chryseobacterium gleum TaxID=250 RepID=UPI001E54822C|nr:hypothetical protein [Chryseobacterium gleum]MCD9617428.1 hypothetical protein [Chryseobacterium gleum]